MIAIPDRIATFVNVHPMLQVSLPGCGYQFFGIKVAHICGLVCVVAAVRHPIGPTGSKIRWGLCTIFNGSPQKFPAAPNYPESTGSESGTEGRTPRHEITFSKLGIRKIWK
jgi:hypothetical protein